MPEDNNRNLKQDLSLVKLTAELENLKERFERFVSNDFHELKMEVKELRVEIQGLKSRLFWTVGIGIVVLLASQIVLKFFN